MKSLIVLGLAIMTLATTNSCKKKGCTDPMAENYKEKAKKDDGSCKYFELTGTISSVTTIAENKTVKICGDLNVESDLIFAPGVTAIMCENASITIAPNGSFSCEGTAQKPITIKGQNASKGYWQQIAIKSNNPKNKITHTTIKDGGGYWYYVYSSVFIENGAQLSISNSTISNSKDIGLYIDNTANLVSFSNNTFSNNGIYGVSISASNVQKLDAASAYSQNNGQNYIAVNSNTLNNNNTLQATSTPYLLLEGLYVNGNLTVNPGTNLKVEANKSIEVSATGSFTANGTIANPIIIEGRVATNGYWNGLHIHSNNTSNLINHTTIKDGGGYWYYEYSNVAIMNNARLNIDNSVISNSYSWGIYVYNGGSIYTNNTSQNNQAGVASSNTLSGNGMNPNATCTNGCAIFFE